VEDATGSWDAFDNDKEHVHIFINGTHDPVATAPGSDTVPVATRIT
jgi:hypothetical protein